MTIEGDLLIDAVVQYLGLWEAVTACQLQIGSDSFRWKWTSSGSFTARSAYLAFFKGTTTLPRATHMWDSFVPMAYRMHAWLALRRRCWTADRCLCHGLQSHALCPMCIAPNETIACPWAMVSLLGFGPGLTPYSLSTFLPQTLTTPSRTGGQRQLIA
jgi:hypothetical protein